MMGMRNATAAAIFALIINAGLCISFAEAPDTFMITSAILGGAFILTLKGDING